MPSSREYLSYIMEQLAPLEGITTRQMMGEYIIYYQGKIAAELCDDRLLVKPVPAALALLPDAPQEPALPRRQTDAAGGGSGGWGFPARTAGGHGAGAARPKAKKTDGEKGVTGYGTMDHSAAGCKCKRKK